MEYSYINKNSTVDLFILLINDAHNLNKCMGQNYMRNKYLIKLISALWLNLEVVQHLLGLR